MFRSDLSPWNLFKESCLKYPDRFVVVHNQERLTYMQVYEKATERCDWLQQGDFLIGGLYLPNSVEFICCLLALNRLKKVTVPLSYQLKGESLCERINYSDIEVLITDEKGYSEICNVKEKLNVLALMILDHKGGVSVYKIGDKKPVKPDLKKDTFGICFTGGSTSKPKGVVLSNRAVSGNALAVAEVYGFKSTDRFLMARPFTQAGPIASDLLMALSCGAGVVIMNDLYHPAVFLKAIEDYKPTTTYLVRTMLAQILEYPQIRRYDLGSMKRIILGAMITPEKVIKETLEKFPGIELYNAYGLSEASVRVSFAGTDDVLQYPGTVGRAMRGCSMEVYKSDGSKAQNGEEGEIYVQTEYIMDGYYKYPELTKEALTEKGLRTRDKGYRNEQGLYFIVGRVDDLIIQGGNNVYPIEIEEVLLLHPSVNEAVVLGIEDEKLGQKIVAVVRVKTDSGVLQQELYKWCRANLEDRKIPREFLFVDRIPRNEMGKINKNELKALFGSLHENNKAVREGA